MLGPVQRLGLINVLPLQSWIVEEIGLLNFFSGNQICNFLQKWSSWKFVIKFNVAEVKFELSAKKLLE